MMIDNEYDVIVVGGGPAGLSAGVRCANEGIKVLLIERDPILTAKKSWMLGSGEGRNKAKKLGIIDVAEIGCHEIRAATLECKHPSGKGVRTKGRSSELASITVEQNRLTQYMLDKAPKLSIKDKTSVIGAKRSEHRVSLKLSDGELIKGKIIIDASGGTRELSRMLGRKFNQEAVWICYGYTIKGIKVKEFGVDPDEYAWIWGSEVRGKEVWDYCIGPKGEEEMDFVVYKYPLLDKINPFYYGEPPIGMNQKRFCKWYLQEVWERISAEYKEQLKRAEKITEMWGLYGETWETKPYDDNLLMVGDAAGHASPWMGEGVLQSLIFGKDAGDIAIESVTKGVYSKSFLKRYYKRLKADDLYNRGLFSFARFYFPRINEGMIDGFHEYFNHYTTFGEEFLETGWKVLTSGKFKVSEGLRFIPGFILYALKGYIKGMMEGE
jgi:digeranylgeranylglycerophospholipid reductase